MNLVYVTHAYPRSEGDVAGAFIERLAVALQHRGHSIRVIAPSDRGRGGESELNGVSVSRVRYASGRRETLAYTGTMVESARSLAGAIAAANLVRVQAAETNRLCQTQQIDVVHAQWWIPGGMSAWWARLKRVPYVVTVHGTDVRILERSAFARVLARRVFRGAAAVTAVSSYLAERVARIAGIDSSSITVQPMPIEVTRYNRMSRGGAGIVSVGRLTKQKNLGVVLQAMVRLRERNIDVPLRLVGDGPERQNLNAQAKRLNLSDKVEFVGEVEPSRVPDAVGDADVSVFAATQEGFGLAAAESFMLGIPVVALQAGGGVKDVVPASGAGRLVQGNPEDVAAAIADLLQDGRARQLAAEQGAELKRQFEPDAVAAVYESVYEHATASRR